MPPNPAQKVPPVAHRVAPGPHSRDVNSCPREREGGYNVCVCVYLSEPVSRDQILRHARVQENIDFRCSSDHEQDWQPFPVDPYSAICDDQHTTCT